MIVKNYSSYLGLDLAEVYIEDTSDRSLDYFVIDSIPRELSSGKNIIKLSINADSLEVGYPVMIETVDSAGNTIFSYIPDYYDSLKRRLIVIEVDKNVMPGMGRITLLGVAKNVPDEWKGEFNLRWSHQLSIQPNKTNSTEIIFANPPEIIVQTKLKPAVDAVYRNNVNRYSVVNVGRFTYDTPNFFEYIGDTDSANNIFQPEDVSKLLGTYVSGSNTGSITVLGNRPKSQIRVVSGEGYHSVIRNSPVIKAQSVLQFDSVYNGAKLVVNLPDSISPVTASNLTSSNLKYETYVEYALDRTTLKLVDPYKLVLKDTNGNQFEHIVKSFNSSNYILQYTPNKIPSPIPNVTSSGGVYDVVNAFLDININGLTPLSGDITRIKVYAQESNKPGEYQELDSYAFSVVDTLLDTNYTNHISYADSIYRLTGYFAPLLLPLTSSTYDSSSFLSNQFSSTYWGNTNNCTDIEVSPLGNRNRGTINYLAGTASYTSSTDLFSNSAMIFFSGSVFNPIPTSSAYPVTYEVSFDVLMNTDGFDVVGQVPRGVRWYPVLISASVNLNSTGTITAIDANGLLNDRARNINGSAFNTYYTGSYICYLTVPPLSSSILGIMAYDASTPLLVSSSIANIRVREVGNYLQIINKYWEIGSSSTAPTVYTSSAVSPLIDSVYIYPSSSALCLNQNTNDEKEYWLFRTKHGYTLFNNTTYVIRFNAIGRKDISGKTPKITVFGQNSGSYGYPFKESLSLIGEYIGEIKLDDGEDYHYYDQVEMYFTTQGTGNAKFAFQINQGVWNLSEISVKEYDPIGFTPNHVRIFAKIPGIPSDYEGTILSFKFEYYDANSKQSDYVTYVNDIRLTNIAAAPAGSGLNIQDAGSFGTLQLGGASNPVYEDDVVYIHTNPR